MTDRTLRGRANPFLWKKVQWIVKNEDFSMSGIVREGARLFIAKYEREKGKEIPICADRD